MLSWKLTDPVTIFVVGYLLGALAVFLGIGGGPLNVAALSLLFRLAPRRARSTVWPSSSSASFPSSCSLPRAVRFGPLTSPLFRS